MPWTPGIGVADLDLSGAFTPGVGVADLNLSILTTSDDRNLTVSATAGGMIGAIHLALDLGLLNSIASGAAGAWQDGETRAAGWIDTHADASAYWTGTFALWGDGHGLRGGSADAWRDSTRHSAVAADSFQDAALCAGRQSDAWRDAPLAAIRGRDGFQDAAGLSGGRVARWNEGQPVQIAAFATFREGSPGAARVAQYFSDATRITPSRFEKWRQAGYPAHARRTVPPIVVPGRDVFWDGHLDLRCPVPSFPVYLNLQESQCGGALAYIPILRVYRVLNSSVLVRLPDRTELPCIAQTVETDSESWCWSLSATLKSDPAWTLLRPVDGQPWEVESTINGRVWQFVVDEITSDRSFGSHTVSLRARSRSAWLDDPYQPSITVTSASATSAQQVAELALDGTGWSLVWPVDEALAAIDWLIPAGVYSRQGTIIGRVGTIVKTVGWGLYTDPALDSLTAYPHYPMASWLWGALSPVLSIPEDVAVTIQRQPVYAPSYNGLYLSGTDAGKLVFAKIAGTDGLLQPADPLVDSLFCDESGVAARQRAIYELSKSGFSETLTVATPYLTAMGLLRPGQLLEVGSLRGMIRKVSVTAAWDRGLKVIQTLGLEVRP
jgi:hypothetical protein